MKFSSGLATRSSTSPDVAPGYTATQAPCLMVNCGISCLGMMQMPSMPRNTSMPIRSSTMLWLHIADSMNERLMMRLGFLVMRALIWS